MTHIELLEILKGLPSNPQRIVTEITRWSRGSNLPIKEQAEISDVDDGLDCDGGFVYKITEL